MQLATVERKRVEFTLSVSIDSKMRKIRAQRPATSVKPNRGTRSRKTAGRGAGEVSAQSTNSAHGSELKAGCFVHDFGWHIEQKVLVGGIECECAPRDGQQPFANAGKATCPIAKYSLVSARGVCIVARGVLAMRRARRLVAQQHRDSETMAPPLTHPCDEHDRNLQHR
ncbi:MAG: hypothetical protein EPN70_04085 [Paraburkholderia sp.]|uniref:hypothetical protein n=1 Tax=Paraburkholderia sp. TaxID=1926495 RepID=UPI00121C61B2|nr:hypothetical protein [Paraburkholderia sp.]TAM07014.1 MAG: hypothetical protein EPN70_04085 [Paraburkholderia sp.]